MHAFGAIRSQFGAETIQTHSHKEFRACKRAHKVPKGAWKEICLRPKGKKGKKAKAAAADGSSPVFPETETETPETEAAETERPAPPPRRSFAPPAGGFPPWAPYAGVGAALLLVVVVVFTGRSPAKKAA